MINYLIIISLVANTMYRADFPDIFGSDYSEAVSYVAGHQNTLDSLSLLYETDSKTIAAIVFPEALRYSMIRDILETGSLELMYVSTGIIDFSIGPFQLKPSFLEELESYKCPGDSILLAFQSALSYHGTSDIDVRRERLERLKSPVYQLVYVNLFYNIMKMRFPDIDSMNDEYRVRFLSTAFNHDFMADRKELENYMTKRFFPWGPYNHKTKYNYADIAWYYFEHELKPGPIHDPSIINSSTHSTAFFWTTSNPLNAIQ